MGLAIVRDGMVLEALVLLFQVVGAGGLLLSRFRPATSWARRGRFVVLLMLVGLAIVGAACRPHSSGMGLYAGATMTVLLVGMISEGTPRTYGDDAGADVIEQPLPI